MKFNIPYLNVPIPNIPSQQQIKQAATIAAGVVGGIVVIKLIADIAKKVHEKKQDKSIKKLTNQVSDLEARLSILEQNQV